MKNRVEKWLVEPISDIEKSEDKRHVRLLSALLLIAMLTLLVEKIVSGILPLWILVLFFVCYLLSRTAYFRVAAVGSILVLCLPNFWVIFVVQDPDSRLLLIAFVWLIIPILLSGIFLSIRETAVVVGACVLGMILLPILKPAITWSMLSITLGYVITTGIIVLIVMRQRDLNERDRQAELAAQNRALEHEIAAREQTEAALRQNEEASKQFQQKLIALQELNIELAQINSFDELCRQAISMGRSRLGFDRLAIWFLDEQDPDYMVGSFGTDEEGNLRDERGLRLPTSPKEVFEIKNPVETPARTWHRRELYNCHHRVVGEGWTVVALLWHGDKVIGILSTDNLIEKRPFSPEQLELLSLYAATVSHLVVRKQEEDKAKQRREMLEKVVELGKQVTQVSDLRNCLLKIYETIQTDLEFDRVGLFTIEEETQLAQGTFGTDREGNRTEEWGFFIPLADMNEVSETGEVFLPSDSLLFIQDYEAHFGPLTGKNKEDMTGVKQYVRILSWVGEHPVLIINVDNLVSQRFISEEQVEALYLFSGYASLALQNAGLFEQVQEAEQRYRAIFENAAEGIFQIAEGGYFLRANPTLAHMFGYESSASFIHGITDIKNQIYARPGQYKKLMTQLSDAGRVTNFEFEAKRRDGSRVCLSQNVQAVYNENGEFLCYEGTVQDVTERRQAEADREMLIRELERRNAELERFTYTVSHDLKSPLITIQGFLGFVEKDARSGNIERLETDITHITEATRRMRHLLDDLLELSRVGRLVNPSQAVPFADLVNEALDLVSGRLSQQGVQVEVASDLPLVFVDRRRLVEVLQNLLDNAAKFMGDRLDPCIEIGVETRGDETAFFVRDNGIGILPEYHEMVFGLFERLDSSIDGTGIGLALVKRIIEVHNGRLWVESDGPGKGCTFYFTLPLADTALETDLP